MALISSSLPNFINGVSQQPYSLRMNTQGETQENGMSTVSQGLKKRPPSIHLAKISDTPLSDVYVHTINRDETERYVLFVANGQLQVYTVDGQKMTVNPSEGALNYLVTTKPASESFSSVTVADYTWIVNKTVTVAPDDATTPPSPHPYEALINVKSGNYGKTYEIKIDGVQVAAFTTPNGANADEAPQIATDYIAAQLKIGLDTALIPNEVHGNSIYVYKDDADFDIEVNDGFGNNAMVAIKERTQKFADLPTNPKVDGVIIEIVGEASSTFDNYYVRFTCDDSGSSGVWKECAAPGISLGVEASTMPHTLVREADGTFTFKPAEWKPRKVGDENANPQPSFVTRKINEMFFYQNRLGVLSDENVIMSESGTYFNFYRTTVTALVDSDVIDITAAHTKVSILNYAVPYNRSLLLFSEQTQFIVPPDTVLSPTTMTLQVSTEYPCDTRVKPVAAGRNCYFSVNKGNYTSVREYYTDANGSGDDAMEITAHVPRYIPSGGFKLASSINEDLFAYLSKEDKHGVYIYKYFFTSSNEKAQASWSRWSFAPTDTILNVDFIQSEMYVIINRADGVYFEKLDCSLGYVGPEEPYAIMLDRKTYVEPEELAFEAKGFFSSQGVTKVPLSKLPYRPDDGDYYAVTLNGQPVRAGEFVKGEIVGDNIEFQGDLTGCKLAIGRGYTFVYGISPITYKTSTSGGSQKSDTEGRLQIRKLAFNYSEAGYFRVEVQPDGRQTNTYIYSGRTLGQPSATVGAYSIQEGRFIVPVIAKNSGVRINVINDSPVPSALISADWEGFYVKRSSGV
jgi:hypothetical protein